MQYKTLAQSISIEGYGLHTGTKTSVTLRPIEGGRGITFKVIKEGTECLIPADVAKLSATDRSTTLKSGDHQIQTIEHLLAALYANYITAVEIIVHGEEIPILDGSARPWMETIAHADTVELDNEIEFIELEKIIDYTCPETGARYTAIPDDNFEISVTIDFDSPILAPQHAGLNDLSEFGATIANCRTFVFLHDVLPLLKLGLIKGGSLDNAILIAEETPDAETQQLLLQHFPKESDFTIQQGVLAKGGLQYPNEMARHKLLDVIGDLALTGTYFKGRIIVHRPSHKSNTAFAAVLKSYAKEVIRSKGRPKYDPEAAPLYDNIQIQGILPHRYPILLVDKIMELTDQYVVGVKNVTFNESFFQGHFPGNPVMPGVLQIEAMAQTGGILAISLMPDDHQYDTYFLKIDNAKFKQKVGPGDTLVFKLELLEPIRRGICVMQASAYVGSKLATEAVLTAQLVPRPKNV
jgi:UDP-3-O-[3-hydroxymyristoyl] N-acetylglucosamine deacetylase/3-hydroxyacyl-[acyl-carrier-protein] dehydratase